MQIGKYGMVRVRYVGERFGRWRGRVTCYMYNFKRRFPVRDVDSRDALHFVSDDTYKDKEGRQLFKYADNGEGDIAAESDFSAGEIDTGESHEEGGQGVGEGPAQADRDVGHQGGLPSEGAGESAADQ